MRVRDRAEVFLRVQEADALPELQRLFAPRQAVEAVQADTFEQRGVHILGVGRIGLALVEHDRAEPGVLDRIDTLRLRVPADAGRGSDPVGEMRFDLLQ